MGCVHRGIEIITTATFNTIYYSTRSLASLTTHSLAPYSHSLSNQPNPTANMQFTTLLVLLAPIAALAMPATPSSTSIPATSPNTYTYAIPAEFLAAHPDAPATVSLSAAQFADFSAMVPVQVTETKDVIVLGDANMASLDSEMGIASDMSTLKFKCTACKIACAVLAGPLRAPCRECFLPLLCVTAPLM
jgi:hypothetical protein